MPNLLVRDVPQHVVARLKQRAAQHRRSLQQETLAILEEAAERSPNLTAAETARAIRDRLRQKGVAFDDSTPLIRADRER